jgi:formate hydrogenlyase subunit 3/multisubunit Na+/H+ antiporter MnhD subunit
MSAALPVLILLTSLIPAFFGFFLAQKSHRLRNLLNLGGALLKVGLIAFMLAEVMQGTIYETRLGFAPGLYLLLRVDALSLLFVSLSAFLWLLTTIYAIAYLGNKAHLSRFFGFFSLCVAATTGIALSGTLISFFIFFELLTLSTWPLVVHKQDAKSIAAGRSYLAYALPATACSSALTGAGAAMAAGSQPCSGTSAALAPSPAMNSAKMIRRLVSSSLRRSAGLANSTGPTALSSQTIAISSIALAGSA